jgi:NodT family efflux transporter outer membrane factor (OMF) lipoprotein
LLAIAIGYQFPQQQQVSGSASRQKQSGNTFNNFTLGFNVGWEIDFWGRFSRQVESSSAELDASVAGFDGVVISLVGQVAQSYILIRTYQDQIEVTRNNIQLQEESLRIARANADAGAVSELDVNQGEVLVNATRASLAKLEIPLQQAKNSLAVLLGKPPQDMACLLFEKRDIPSVRAQIALGMPQDLIRRRPDLRIAERQLAAQCAQIGVSVTELYPHLSIGGSIGTSAKHGGDLFRGGSETWSTFGGFSWNIFNYGRLTSNVRLQDALFQQLLVDYRESILQAQAEVENAIVAHLKSQEQLESYKLAEAAAQRAVDISTSQYQEGAIPYDTVINTLSAHLQQQNQLSVARGDVANSLVQVFKSLGGGWEIREDRDPVDTLPPEMKEEMRKRTGQWKGTLQ